MINQIFQNDLFQRIGWGLLHSTWQIAVLAAVYYFGRFAISQRHVRFRYHFGYAVLLAMFVAPVVTMTFVKPINISTTISVAANVSQNVMPIPQNSKEHGGPKIVSLEEFMAAIPPGMNIEEVTLHSDDTQAPSIVSNQNATVSDQRFGDWYAWAMQQLPNWLPVLVAGWFCGVIVLSCRLLSGLWGIRQMRRSGQPLADEYWQTRLTELCRTLNVKANVRLLGLKRIDSPVLIGLVRPVILVPLSLLTWFTPEEIEAILVHELAHVRRHDYLANLVQMVLETLLFYHPLFWWVSNAVRDDREYICDDFVVDQGGTDSLVYAKTLESLEHFRQIGDKEMKRMLFTPAAAARPLLNRIRRILQKRESDRTCGWLAGLTLLLTLTCTPLTLALFQSEDEKPKMEPAPTATYIQSTDGGAFTAPPKAEASDATLATTLPSNGLSDMSRDAVPANPNVAPPKKRTSQPVNQLDPATLVQAVPSGISSSEPSATTIRKAVLQTGDKSEFVYSPALNHPAEAPVANNPLRPMPSTVPPPAYSTNPNHTQQYSYGYGYSGLHTAANPPTPMMISKPATKKPSGPISSKLYPYNDVLKLFSMDEFFNYLRSRLDMEAFDDAYQIFPTQKNALLVTGTENVHETMKKIMDDLKTTIEENKALLEDKEVSVKVIPLKHGQSSELAPTLMQFIQGSGDVIIAHDQRTNSILLRGSRNDLDAVEALIQKLDAEPTKEQEKTSTYQQQYSR